MHSVRKNNMNNLWVSPYNLRGISSSPPPAPMFLSLPMAPTLVFFFFAHRAEKDEEVRGNE